ncbi:sensor domain-containing diguanylate cyclase [Methylotenera mobilis]|uniref:diguanylate cyclase n=1 Tax=Methylotenera mobilis (strain JLW8 / ATCC BAA-1282 / DSM 17540) TaxID=583345 RepID=C6WXM3_METML|nr:GGDEF domain-containing protein [Methylotenera mobilis]ACT48672.1 diguanylate cyclase [Methylotenera mobilis JLW8]
MEQKLTPLEIARQTLIQLSKSQKPPTPENYSRVYDEIAGGTSPSSKALLDTTLNKILAEKSKEHPKYAAIAKRIPNLIEKNDAVNLDTQLRALILNDADKDSDIQWGPLLRYLLKQLELNHTELTISNKREGLNRVISTFGSDSAQLAEKIQTLITSWGEGKAADIEISASHTPSLNHHDVQATKHSPPPDNGSSAYIDIAAAWRDILVRTIRIIVMPKFADSPSAANRVEELIKEAEAAQTLAQIEDLNSTLRSTLLRAEMQTDAQRRMQEALIEILRLLVSSMAELTIEDEWLHAQIAIVKEIVSKPLKIDTVYNAESSLKELIFKQAQIKPGLIEAKETLKSMVNTFVSRLADITSSTGTYQNKIQEYHNQINAVNDIGELNTILEHLVDDIGEMNTEAKANHETLLESQKKAEAAEKKINELTLKLDYISEAAHEDFLTGALNRRGMDEALIREFERSDRHGTSLSLAMLDVDHFKKINDTMGHSTGDKALAHLSKVVKGILRSTDVLARYGGEEFVILLPGSNQNDAVTVVSGLQRDLTKNFFLHNNERVLITFSAGVAERVHGESVDSVLPRADAALYLAKQSGRNRVVGAEPPKSRTD